MLRSRLLPASAALACLLGSGCDYWRNLTGSKAPDRGTLTLTVTDEWTKEPLAEAFCLAAGTAESLPMDADGRFTRPDMPTGRYDLTCGAPGYHERRQEADVLPGVGRQYHVKLGRTAAEWYPNHPERQVQMYPMEGSLRFPGRLRLGAFPANDTFFTYRWTSSVHGPETSQAPHRWLETPDLGGDESEVEFSVTVVARLGGQTYDVGMARERMTYHRNRKPGIIVDHEPGSNIMLGCLEANYDYNLTLSASDTDGVCRSFSIYSKGTTSSLGPVDLRLDECPFQRTFKFSLAPFPAVPADAAPLRRRNEFVFRAVDDDGAATQDTLAFETFTNSRPKVSISPVKPPDLLYPYDTLSFRIVASDQDGSLHGLTVDWDNEDAPVSYDLHISGSDQYDKQFNRIFWEKPGRHEIVATITDGCSQVSDTLPILIRENQNPRITKQVIGYIQESGEYQIKVSATDADAGPGNDSISLSVNWNTVVGGVTNVPKAQEIRNLTLGRIYPRDHPYETVRIIITALDRYDGSTFDTVTVPRHVVLGLPPGPPAPANGH